MVILTSNGILWAFSPEKDKNESSDSEDKKQRNINIPVSSESYISNLQSTLWETKL